MFNYVTVEFPTITKTVPPNRVMGFALVSQRYAHEVVQISFRDWDVEYSAVKPGTPIRCTLRNPNGSRQFYGYVQYIVPKISPGSKTTDVVAIGASYVFKQASQRIFQGLTSDQIVKQIALEQGFAAEVEPHPRVWDQVAQAGHTDLELMVRLAKHSGYTLRIQDTTVYFKPFNFDFNTYRPYAPVFTMRETSSPAGSSLYAFDSMIGESTNYGDAMKAAVRVAGVDPDSHDAVNAVKNKPGITPDPVIRVESSDAVFDRFATNIVAPGWAPAYYEALAADARNKYPYRAMIETMGHPGVRPDTPVYLDGIGPQYSGYWMVLSIEHQVVEESLNNLTYVSIMEVGTDSLGTASVGTDGSVLPYPYSGASPQAQGIRRDKEGTVLAYG